MIGNDIVDLALARQESNWQRKGFLDKLFTAHEQQLIQIASEPDVMVWTLWSMKESAYKLVVRETGRRFFAPLQFVCQLNAPFSAITEGQVLYQSYYRTTSSITEQYVASVASAADTVQPSSQVIIRFDQTDYHHQHQIIRDRLTQYVAACWAISESQVQIQKDEAGVPTLVVHDLCGTSNRPISLSHHGQYGAFVL